MPVAHYENFPVASWLVPGRLRPAVGAIYAFARAADDLADEGDEPPAQRLSQLDRYAVALDRIEAGETPAESPFAALATTIRNHTLPVKPFRDLLSAFRQDVVKTRYANYAELLDYCRRSANPIGALLLHLYAAASQENIRHANAICTGLQLANFWQDVAIDWAKGRLYLPAADMAQFDVHEAHIALARCDENWRRLIAFEVERTRLLLESGRPLTRALPLRLNLELKLVLAGGLRILKAIEAAHGDVFRHRPMLRRRDWAAMSATALFRS